MIEAALRGKLACRDLEDALTSAVFGRLRYLPPSVLVRWFQSCRPHGCACVDWPSETPEISFWPTWRDVLREGVVEPDVILHWDGFDAVVEAKLWSGKSQIVEEIENSYDVVDQLAREWAAALARGKDDRTFHPKAIVYLTPDPSPPDADLRASIAALRKHGHEDVRLLWLCWSALEQPLSAEVRRGEHPHAAIAADLLAYLDAVNVLRFRGWSVPRVPSGELWSYQRALSSPYFAALPELGQQRWRYGSQRNGYFDGLKATVNPWSYSGGER